MQAYQLLSISPAIGQARADLFIGPLNAAMARFQIVTPAQQAHFLAQVLHESGNLSRMVENLNYSAAGLLSTFNTPKVQRFTVAQANQYGRTADHPADQRMIANIAYASRMGNGPIHSDEGWIFCGRGPLQITGKDNYARCGDALGLNLIAHPELLAQPEAGCLAAGWFWHIGNRLGHSLNALADAGEVDAISRAINGGNNGLAERAQLTRIAMQILNRQGVPA
jgi:putative chitinase